MAAKRRKKKCKRNDSGNPLGQWIAKRRWKKIAHRDKYNGDIDNREKKTAK